MHRMIVIVKICMASKMAAKRNNYIEYAVKEVAFCYLNRHCFVMCRHLDFLKMLNDARVAQARFINGNI